MSSDIGINFAIVNNIHELQKTPKAMIHMILWTVSYVFKLRYIYFVENNKGKYFFLNLKCGIAMPCKKQLHRSFSQSAACIQEMCSAVHQQSQMQFVLKNCFRWYCTTYQTMPYFCLIV